MQYTPMSDVMRQGMLMCGDCRAPLLCRAGWTTTLWIGLPLQRCSSAPQEWRRLERC
jgi:hypothetical protein